MTNDCTRADGCTCRFCRIIFPDDLTGGSRTMTAEEVEELTRFVWSYGQALGLTKSGDTPPRDRPEGPDSARRGPSEASGDGSSLRGGQ